jgi:hypothetical protein
VQPHTLYSCRWLTDNALAAAARSCPNLSRLNVEGCRKLTPAAISKAVWRMKALTSLNVAHIWFRNERAARHDVAELNAALSGLPEHCPAIRHLHIDRLPTVTPGTLQRLCQVGTAITLAFATRLLLPIM